MINGALNALFKVNSKLKRQNSHCKVVTLCCYLVSIRVESGSHLLIHLTHWPTEQSGCHPNMTHLWPTCWSFLFKSNVTRHEKFWFGTMPDFFIFGRIQNRSLAQKMKSLNITCFKTTWDKKLVSHQWYFSGISASIRPKVHSLTRCQLCLLKNMWYPR